MKFAKQRLLLELPVWRASYVDYDALKHLAEQFSLPAVDDGGSLSDDSVSHTPRHARAAREHEASGLALLAAGGATAARPACEAAFLALAEAELGKAARLFCVELGECEARVRTASALLDEANALAAADALHCGCGDEGVSGAGARGDGGGGNIGDGSSDEAGSADASPTALPAASSAAVVAAAASAAAAAMLRASAHIDDLRGFASLNLAALEKGAKKFDKRWHGLLAATPSALAAAGAAAAAGEPPARAPPQPLIGPRVAKICAHSPLADETALIALSTRCAELMQLMPPPPERHPSASTSAAAPASSSSSSSPRGGAAGAGILGAGARPGFMPGPAPEPLLVKGIDLESLPLGAISRLRVRLAESALGEPLSVPVLVARGRHAGPVLGITSALHGNELAGIPVIHRLFSELDVEHLSGTIVAVPVVNTVGFQRYQRGFSDGQDLNRIMPGKKGGSSSQSFAHALVSRIVRHVDFLLDLHTASFGRANSLYVRADMRDAHTHRLALLQRPQIIVHNSGPDGSLRGACAALGKPCVTIEIGDPQVIDPLLTESALRGVRNTLRHLKMAALRGHEDDGAGPPPVVVSRSFWLFSQAAGILVVKPALAAWVRRGDVIAEIHSVWGDLVERIVATVDAIVVGKSTNPVCNTGDRLLHLGVCEQSFDAKADDGHQ